MFWKKPLPTELHGLTPLNTVILLFMSLKEAVQIMTFEVVVILTVECCLLGCYTV
jgi:hypothetical protein